MDLLKTTIALVSDSEIPTDKICTDTGLKRRWLDKVLKGQIEDPSVNKIQLLHNYMIKATKQVEAA